MRTTQIHICTHKHRHTHTHTHTHIDTYTHLYTHTHRHTHTHIHTHTLNAATADTPDALRVEDNFDLSDTLLLEVNREGFVFFADRTAALPDQQISVETEAQEEERVMKKFTEYNIK
jgi:hypothetical protein